MCLSTVYELGMGNTPKKLCEHICSVSVSGDRLVFTDIMGNETECSGIIKNIDLTRNTITINVPAKAGNFEFNHGPSRTEQTKPI
jgi:predicted RNA-binding protein